MQIIGLCHRVVARICLVALCIAGIQTGDLAAQHSPLDRVLTISMDTGGGPGLDVDRGSVGLWQRLQKLRTTASALHTTAHPDDEHAGLLTYLSRGVGARTALLSLNRGEAGANAIGPELFDALGLIRTEELRLSSRYYALDDQYYSVAIDYGYSKTLDESLRSWDRDTLLGDMVRVLRLNRPMVVISRFHGSERDGHGNHQAVGGLTPDAVLAAADPTMFPEQIASEGLRPWTVRKLYRGGVREEEPWHVHMDAGRYSPWLGTTYQNFGAYGLSLQRSQTSGRMRGRMGPAPYYYEHLHEGADGVEEGFFDGLDTSISGIFALTGETPPAGSVELAKAIEGHVEDAIMAYDVSAPALVAADLAQGLQKTRALLAMLAAESEAAFLLRIKEEQFAHAIHTALGVQLTATATPLNAPGGTMSAVVPGQQFHVEMRFLALATVPVANVSLALSAQDIEAWEVVEQAVEAAPIVAVDATVRVPEAPMLSRRYFYRNSIRENEYTLRNAAYAHMPAAPVSLEATARYEVSGEEIVLRRPVVTPEANLPYGYVLRELTIAPALAVNTRPEHRIVVAGRADESFTVSVDLLSNEPEPLEGVLRLDAPAGWPVDPERMPFTFTQAGQRQAFAFQVTPPVVEEREYVVEAVAEAGGQTYREGYDVIRHRDLETRHLYKPARVRVRGLRVNVAPDLAVGYVMGVGDEVPAGIAGLGATVDLLTEQDLAAGELGAYDAVVIGTRAYAVRKDLHTYNARLLEYAHAGGNLIVLYQTQEFVPDRMAPYAAQLPRRAEEVSEEDAQVTVLEPDHPLFHTPNRITPKDFDGWVEQRGSKFFTEWDERYTPLVEMHDTGQDPQHGAWLTARYGDGYYTYVALAIHRQTPYAVPGPYRLLANLLSMGSRAE